MTGKERDALITKEFGLYAPNMLKGFLCQMRNYHVSEFLDLHDKSLKTPLLENPPQAFSSLNHPHDLLESIRKNDNNVYLFEALIGSWDIQLAVKLYKEILCKNLPRKLHKVKNAGKTIIDQIDVKQDKFMAQIPFEIGKPYDELIKQIAQEMFVAGYFLAYTNELPVTPTMKLAGVGVCLICFEKKFAKQVIELSDTLYHVSPVRYFKKIQRHGLIPLSKSAKFKYPDRVYLFNKSSVKDVACYGVLRHMDAKPGEKLDFFSSIDNVYVVYAIDKKKLLNHPLFKSKKMVFYVDPQYDGKVGGIEVCQAIFTYSAIPRELIKDTCYVYDVRSKTPGKRLKFLRTANFR